MGWRIIGEGRGGFGGHEEEMERELRRAYEEGFEEGRREAVADTVSVAATDKVAATANVASMTAAGMSMTTPTANAVA